MSEHDQFESWFEENTGWDAEDYPNKYLLDVCYEAWQASREALKAEQEPIGEVQLGDYDDTGSHPDARVVCLHEQADWENFPECTKLYLNPQAYLTSHHPIDTTPNQYDALGKGGEQ
ncbi:hypothetical protein [Pseudescherichia sp.]|uniref:hypothetical protein n=1 Tax=Pseudescherichia sp. TaxID=2055881 RepID=UPI00289A938C|nr:hypothetical protein [Pseudescherichia sp.]